MQVLIFVFNLLTKDKTLEQAIEETKPLMQLVFYCMDKVKRYKLSREAKNKADKNRTKVRVTNSYGTIKLISDHFCSYFRLLKITGGRSML